MKRGPLNQISSGTNVIFNMLFIAISICCLLPFVLVFSVSISNEKWLIHEGYRLIPREFSLASYGLLLKDITRIAQSYGITILVSIVGTITSLILVASYAYPLSRKDFAFRKFFSMFLFITMLFNGGLVPFYILYTQYLNVRNSIIALILPYLLNPFYVIVMRTFFITTIPDSLVESAKIDGAKELYIMRKIIFPLSLPAFASIGLLITLVYWNDWFMSLIFISKGNNISIQFYMYKLIMSIQFLLNNPSISGTMINTEIPGESARMAMAILGIGPIVLAYPFFQRYFIKGLTVGAVKG